MTDLDTQLLDAVSTAMEEPSLHPPGSPSQRIEQRIDALIRELDELTEMVVNDATADLVDGQKRLIGTLFTRCGTLVRLLLARHPTPFKARHAA